MLIIERKHSQRAWGLRCRAAPDGEGNREPPVVRDVALAKPKHGKAGLGSRQHHRPEFQCFLEALARLCTSTQWRHRRKFGVLGDVRPAPQYRSDWRGQI